MTVHASDRSVVIVYESMFGATRTIAEAIAEGLGDTVSVRLVPIRDVAAITDHPEVVIVGAPTHAHGLSRPESRLEAARWAMHDRAHLTLEPVSDDGVREWLATKPTWIRHHVAFDTRADMPRIFTGSAAAAIDRRLSKRGSQPLDEPRSFLVDKSSHLLADELDKARAWGAELAARLAARVSASE